MSSRQVDAWLGCRAVFKCENLQRTGAFKFRGACNAVRSLNDAEAACGVVTHSSGNHGAALAAAAGLRGITAHVVMPRTAPSVKRAAVEGYGANVIECEPTLAAREATTGRVMDETGATLIHPFDDLRIITGQATVALELLNEVGELDTIVCPVGGGGLAAGTALATLFVSPSTKVVLGEPQTVDDAYRSFQAGHIITADDSPTIADGLKTSLGEHTFPIIRDHVSRIVTVSEDEIIGAMRFIWTRMKLIIEPSSAVAVAAVHKDRDRLSGQQVGIIISGGNVDLDHLPWINHPT